MRTPRQKLLALSLLLSLLCAIQVQSAPLSEEWTTGGLIHRARRSLLWRWNSLKTVGAGCREHEECATKFCRKKVCSFKVFNS